MSKDLYGDLLQRFTLLSCTEAWDKSAAEVTRADNRQLRRPLARRGRATALVDENQRTGPAGAAAASSPTWVPSNSTLDVLRRTRGIRRSRAG